MENNFKQNIEDLFNHKFNMSSSRLIMDQIVPEDLDSIFEIFGDEKVTEFTDFTTRESKEHAKKIVDYFIKCYHDKEQYRFAIREIDSKKLVGTLGLFSVSEINRMAEIGFELNQSYWRKGYMTEALSLFVNFYFYTLKGHRIEAVVTPGNDSSCVVLQKIGFVKEGVFRERDFFKNAFWDGIVFGILEKDLLKE
ncbi:MAG: GNAT family N-acetyltransferase [Oligoflexia bacterium]|nr:GNAT family N-acetyltransferase [Oligoflexia bacterium]MBF0365899.1 GNAT family N-acetyltransferase [Oligoflexia bacterium]